MNILETLSPDTWDLLVALPYRVGVFISESDDTGGDEASGAEELALRNIVTFYVEDTVKSEFAHEVMVETLNRKAKWETWKNDIEQVPSECAKITKLLDGKVESKEVIALKQNLLEVAIVVAQAYREINESSPIIDRIKQLIAKLTRNIQARFAGEIPDNNEMFLNISPLERAAIKNLADNLHIDMKF